jgi:hypothetical protein
VWSGEVVLVTSNGSFDVALQKAAMIARDTGKPVPIVVVPKIILENGAPRPDSVPVDVEKEFGADADGAGLYVTVHEGKIIVTQNGKQFNLGGGESGFSNGQELFKLSSMPNFMGISDQNNNPNPSENPNGCVVTP